MAHTSLIRDTESSSRLYLDHASAPIPDLRVYEIMRAYEQFFGNPGASHEEGRIAKEKLEEARSLTGKVLGVKKDEIIFTSGGTESNNIAITGLVRGLERAGHSLSSLHAVTLLTEHPSVLECFRALEQEGLSVTYLSVSTAGIIEERVLVDAIRENTVLVSVVYVHGEIGVVQPLRNLSQAVREKKKELSTHPIYIHTDASQAGLYFDITPHTLGVDLMTFDAMKMRGPKGSGALFAKLMTPLAPVMLGGGQERGVRSGTEDVVRAHGFRAALEFAVLGRKERAVSVSEVRDYGIKNLLLAFEGAEINGHVERRSPNNISIVLPGVDAEYAAVILDTLGIACSTRSACFGGDGGGSEVIFALTGDREKATSTLRFTLGEETTRADMDRLVVALQKASVQAKKS